jgi:transcriptional regulator with XRE-family HTH domain
MARKVVAHQTQLELRLDPKSPNSWAVDTSRIEQSRILAGLSYQKLAKAARIDRATLSDFLNGRRHPTLGTVHRVLRCLEVDPKDVFIFETEAA